MITTAYTKSEESNKMSELSAKLLDSKVETAARHQAGAEMAAAEANSAANRAKGAAAEAMAMFEGCQAEVARENRISMAGGIGTLVGAGVGVTAAILVGKRMGLEPNAVAPLVGGGAVVGAAAGGLGGMGVNALLERRAKNKK